MKTKYIKVAVSERLPETAGYYFAFRDDIGCNIVRFTAEGKWFLPENTIHTVTHWLLEVQDHEDEMNEVLEFLIHLKNHKEENGETDYYLEYEKTAWFNAECLLTKLKQ